MNTDNLPLLLKLCILSRLSDKQVWKVRVSAESMSLHTLTCMVDVDIALKHIFVQLRGVGEKESS